MKSRRSLLIVLLAIAVIAVVWSTLLIVAPGQQTLDVRVQRVASQLKCLICQGESVADSPSTLAQQMRASIRRQLQAGRSEQDIIQRFEQSYGSEIVWSPPWQGFSLLAWLVPIAFLLCGIGLVILLLREWYASSPTATKRSRSITGKNVGTGLAPVCPCVALDDDLERYRAQLEAELADDDLLFRKPMGQSNL
jgi:cytochrome c-type biogenesis protein CcmH